MNASIATSDRGARPEDISASLTTSQEMKLVSGSESTISPISSTEDPNNNDQFRELWQKQQQNYKPIKVDEKKKPSNTLIYSPPIESPIDRDVLFARGGLTNHHPGNKRLRELVKQFKMKYDKSNKRVKTEISQYIVDKIRNEGGRFLKRDEKTNLWNVVQNNEARRKASQSLRDCHQYGKKKTTEANKTTITAAPAQPAPPAQPASKTLPSTAPPVSVVVPHEEVDGQASVPNKMLYLLEVVSQEVSQERTEEKKPREAVI